MRACGKSRSWVYGRLGELADDGRAVQVRSGSLARGPTRRVVTIGDYRQASSASRASARAGAISPALDTPWTVTPSHYSRGQTLVPARAAGRAEASTVPR